VSVEAFAVQTAELDLPALAGAFGRRLHAAGLPVTAERSARFASALTVVRPVSRRRLYWTARAVFVSDHGQVRIFDRVFAEVFARTDDGVQPAADVEAVATRPDDSDRPRAERSGVSVKQGEQLAAASAPSGSSDKTPDGDQEIVAPTVASDEELLRHKRFDALEETELADIYRLMARLQVAPPLRRTRRARHDRHGERIDMRRTLRRSLRTAGDPIRLARRRRRVVRRRLVLLCDISGSMEPYARAYLQFLTCAAGAGVGAGAGSGNRTEAFVFATRLTRLTRALAARNPDRAIQRAAAAAPDWSSGTRIGDALKEFNDRHGRRGMARGAVVVILSDGWERGDPTLVGREMQRLARVAYRIVWVNPRVAAAGFSPQAGGMAAALPHCASLVSGHTLKALEEVIEAIAAERTDCLPEVPLRPEASSETAGGDEEPWASATPVAGSSVAMPSGWSPSRGNTTSGWSGGRTADNKKSIAGWVRR
jgi:uncharacterized protein with von Willebrand factor type A (vWA) domain